MNFTWLDSEWGHSIEPFLPSGWRHDPQEARELCDDLLANDNDSPRQWYKILPGNSEEWETEWEVEQSEDRSSRNCLKKYTTKNFADWQNNLEIENFLNQPQDLQ